MWLQVVLFCSCWALPCGGQGPDTASLQRSSDRSGRCHYTFTVAPQDQSCSGGVSGPELEGVSSRLTVLEALVSRLIAGVDVGGPHGGVTAGEGLQEAYSQVTGERDQLQRDREHLEGRVLELQRGLEQLGQEAERLRGAPCPPGAGAPGTQRDDRPHSDPAFDAGVGAGAGAYQEMKAEVTEVPASLLLPGGGQRVTGCGGLLSVGAPVSHRKADSITGKYGVWMQDPEPRGPHYSRDTVWRIDTVGKDVRQLFVYEDMEQFSRGAPTKVLVLPEPVESTGAAMYRGALYYQRKRSRTLIRYDVTSESLASRRDLPHAGFHGQHPYSWGGYTDIDLAVDEQGLWAIYSTGKARGAIVISKLDPESLEVRKSWETKIRKHAVGNAFMLCGRLYTVASYTAPNTTINHTYDTSSGEGRALALPFRNQYRYTSMVDYNPAQRKLFAWDNFHMVTYDVTVGGARPGSSLT